MPRKIRFEEGTAVSKRATKEIEEWLNRFPETVSVKNVEAQPEFQIIDIDLLWTTQKCCFKIEIKADRWHQTGNFFFETHSNQEKNTTGCFLYTEADFIFYYFMFPKILYALPMPKTRNWFKANIKKFKESRTTTPIGKQYYTTVGRLVPIETVMNEVTGVRTACL